MRRTYLVAWSSLALAAAASSAFAGDFWGRVTTDWHRNNMWPSPFVQTDRAAVCEYFALQTNNGWRLQNTIGDAYFDPATQELTLAGQAKVKWIAQQAPASRRTVYVLANEDQQVTSARVASVQKSVERYAVKGPPADVQLTDRDVFGGSGEYYDAIDRAMKGSVPLPRLPSQSTGSGSNGGSGGAAGGAGGS